MSIVVVAVRDGSNIGYDELLRNLLLVLARWVSLIRSFYPGRALDDNIVSLILRGYLIILFAPPCKCSYSEFDASLEGSPPLFLVRFCVLWCLISVTFRLSKHVQAPWPPPNTLFEGSQGETGMVTYRGRILLITFTVLRKGYIAPQQTSSSSLCVAHGCSTAP